MQTLLKEVSEILPGFGFPKYMQGKTNGKYPFYKVGDISKNVQNGSTYLSNSDNYIDDNELEKIKGKLLPKGTVVFAKIGEALKLNRRAITTTPCLIDNNVVGVKANNSGLLDSFLYFFLKRVMLEDYSRATTVPSVRKTDIEEISFDLPPLSEQRAIVAKIEQLFSDLDNGIANLKKAQKQLKIYRQAVLKKAFEGELTRKWREEQTDLPSAEELLQQIKEEREKHYQKQLDEWKKAVKEWEYNGKERKKPSRPKKPKELQPLNEEELNELPELPEGWCWERLGLVANKIQIGPFGSQLHKADYRKEGVPIINPKHIRGQNLKPKERISKGKADSLSQYYLQENDIILGRRGEMGRSAPITSKTNGWFCGTGSLYIRLGQHFKSKLYSLILSEKRVVDYLENQSRGTTMTNLNSQILHSLPIQLIPIAEQSKIVREIETRLSVCDKLEATITESMQKSEALRQSILKRAFEGKLLNEKELEEARNAPDWEPADKLLERIKTEKEKTGNKKSFSGTPSK